MSEDISGDIFPKLQMTETREINPAESEVRMSSRKLVLHRVSGTPLENLRVFVADSMRIGETFWLNADVCEDMGNPHTITVTVVPGDALNEEN